MLLNTKSKSFLFVILIILTIICVSCKNVESTEVQAKTTEPSTPIEVTPTEQSISNETNTPNKLDKVKKTVNEMTIEQKVGQMFIVVPETFSKNGDVSDFSSLDTEKMKKYNIGGLIMFDKNIINPDQITLFNQKLSEFDRSLFISVDEEGGQVARISNNKNFPEKSFENLNTVSDPTRANEIGNIIGAYLTKYKFNLDFAPDADVLLNSQNTVVSKRAFSSDPEIVTTMTTAYLEGLHNNNLLATAKHFPGHGNTTADTHEGFAYSDATLEEMEKTELIPFKSLIDDDIDMMMVSHVIYSNLSPEELPASLNYDIVTSLLIQQMGYDGVIITDGMNMGAIANNYTVEESTVKAIQAGNDIILMPSDFERAYDSIIKAVKDGTITEERINESVTKILLLKSKLD